MNFNMNMKQHEHETMNLKQQVTAAGEPGFTSARCFDAQAPSRVQWQGTEVSYHSSTQSWWRHAL